jgi:predicted GNAT superfamily acetyltransferase
MSLAPETFRAHNGHTVTIRDCESFEELEACVRLQTDTWGYDDGDVIPRRAFVVARHIGGR